MRTCFYTLLFFLACSAAVAQDTTKILFIGNSFTYYNNMPQMFKAFADSAHKPVYIVQQTPGGISVGDIAQGNLAHANNPVVYHLIRSTKWDVVVIQDNQGRFMRDSAQFPSVTASRVVEGHIQLMDSVKAHESCAKVVLFGGWAFKNGYPPYGNTGIELIHHILTNYVVLNDSMNEVIAPIGEAWIKAINTQTMDLWDTDETHPSPSGSYLTASVIFSTIFNQQTKLLNYTGGLSATDSYSLRACADSAVFGTTYHSKYNLGGMRVVAPQYNNGVLQVPGSFASYQWYKGDSLIGQSANCAITTAGVYKAFLKDNDGCRIKSCELAVASVTTGIETDKENEAGISVFPNPSHGEQVIIQNAAFNPITQVEAYSMSGLRKDVPFKQLNTAWQLDVSQMAAGCYILNLHTAKGIVHRKLILSDN